MELAKKTCIPCQGGIPPLRPEEIKPYLAQLPAGWEVVENHHLFKEFQLGSFKQSMDVVNLFADVAEENGHHPDLTISFKLVKVTLYTHKIDGLAEADFILAAKLEEKLLLWKDLEAARVPG